MKLSQGVRQIHRVTSIAFTVTVLLAIVVVVLGIPVGWVYYLPLLPLAVLLPTGLYMFVLPYVAGRRGA